MATVIDGLPLNYRKAVWQNRMQYAARHGYRYCQAVRSHFYWATAYQAFHVNCASHHSHMATWVLMLWTYGLDVIIPVGHASHTSHNALHCGLQVPWLQVSSFLPSTLHTMLCWLQVL